jgi:phosphoglucomutase
MDYLKRYKMWLESPVIDEETRRELLDISANEAELQDRFYKDLEFGTGGLRGIIGAGSNRMNRFTVGKSTQGLANYIIKQGSQAVARGVAIAFDSRYKSREFAEQAALVLNANGIKAYIYEELQPTPLLSFSIRKLGAIAGLVITASHNPPEYNGYKVYWEDGGQVVGHLADEIIEEVYAVTSFEQIKTISLSEAKRVGLFVTIGNLVIDEYVARAKQLCINPSLVKEIGKDIKIIYTPLHGAGNKLVRRVLSELGFEKVLVVPEQELPDHKFPTVKFPNPEDTDAFALAINLAKNENADLIIATDPDCDRVGVALKNYDGEYVLLSGNQTGALLVNYVMRGLKEKNALPHDGKLITTIVTSELGKKIAEYYGIQTILTYTGFKYIAREILKMENNGKGSYIFGYEESYGYMPADFVRDKDAVTASMLICEMAAWYKSRGMTLYDGLLEIWERFGYHADSLKTITMRGIEGIAKIRRIMSGLRENPPMEITGVKIRIIEDYLQQISKDLSENTSQTLSMEEISDVLRYTLSNGWWFAIRPSGTEPKAKIYFSVTGDSSEDSNEKMEKFVCSVMELIQSFEE